MSLSVCLLIIMVLVTLDQVTKMFLMAKGIEIIPRVLYFAPTMNDGAAFSSLKGELVFFIIFTTIALIGMVLLLITKKWSDHPLFKTTLAFMIGGVIGNFIDRIVFGAVRDFILIPPFGFVCNVADIAITAACVMFVVYIFFYRDKEEKSRKDAKLQAGNTTTSEEN